MSWIRRYTEPYCPNAKYLIRSLTECDAQLVIPKFHGPKLTDIPDEDLVEVLVSEQPTDTVVAEEEEESRDRRNNGSGLYPIAIPKVLRRD